MTNDRPDPDALLRGRQESATPGVGLGLANSRAIMHAHGGTLRGVTRESGGARFTLRWPRGEPPAIDDLPAPMPAAETAS